MGLGHESGTAFVPRRHDADAGVPERIEEAEEGLARHRERVPHPRRTQGVRDESPDGSWSGGLDRLGRHLLGVAGVDLEDISLGFVDCRLGLDGVSFGNVGVHVDDFGLSPGDLGRGDIVTGGRHGRLRIRR